ncbi:MAG: DUF1599 domain-containing protein [Bacteroidia bacterium]
MSTTNEQFHAVIAECRELFMKKSRDYGTSWTILRLPSVTDQIYIKALRIRQLQEGAENRVGESAENEFKGIINYCIIALMLWERDMGKGVPANPDELQARYDQGVEFAYSTLQAKNHDYGEAWRDMRVSSITDLILMKILRLKQIEDNAGKTIASEGVDANYIDMLNYAVFALILLSEVRSPMSDA